MLSSTLKVNFCYMEILHIFHSRYHPKMIEYTLKNKQKSKCDFIYEIIQLIIMKVKMKTKKISDR